MQRPAWLEARQSYCTCMQLRGKKWNSIDHSEAAIEPSKGSALEDSAAAHVYVTRYEPFTL